MWACLTGGCIRYVYVPTHAPLQQITKMRGRVSSKNPQGKRKTSARKRARCSSDIVSLSQRTMIRLQSSFLVLCVLVAAVTLTVLDCGAQAQPQAVTRMERRIRLQLYIRSDSKLCQEAKEYAETLSERRGGICIEVIDTLTDKEGLDHYWQLVRRFRVENHRVPMFYVYDRLKVGFSDAEKTRSGDRGSIRDSRIHTIDLPTLPRCQTISNGICPALERCACNLSRHRSGDRRQQEMNNLARQHGITAPHFPSSMSAVASSPAIIPMRTHRPAGFRRLALEGVRRRQGEEEPINRQSEQVENKHALVPLPANWTTASLFPSIGGADDKSRTLATAILEKRTCLLPYPKRSLRLVPNPASRHLMKKKASQRRNRRSPVECRRASIFLGSVISAFVIWDRRHSRSYCGWTDRRLQSMRMWVLVFLLSVLVNIKDRRKIAAIAGTFVVVSGLAYFAFMAAWLNLFMVVGIARPLQIALGVLAVVIGLVNVKDFFAFKKGVTLSIPESAKPGIYARVRRIVTTDYISVAIGLSVILAVVVNVVELMCTAGLPALYTQILTLQQLPAWKNYAYLGLYNVGYMFDDSLMVITFVITLSHRKMREAEGSWLKLISGAVVLALGLAMLFRPDWLQW